MARPKKIKPLNTSSILLQAEVDKTADLYKSAYKEFIKLKCRPLKDTDPKSPEEFCALHNISIGHYLSFSEEPTFADDILSQSLDWAKGKTPELLQILYNTIKTTKSANDVERFMNIVHELKKKKDERSSQMNQFNFFGSLSEERFKSIAQRELGNVEIK